MSKLLQWLNLFFMLGIILGVSACQKSPTQAIETVTTEPTLQPTATTAPTNTPEPERIVWVSSRQDQAASQTQSGVKALAEGSGLQFEALSSVDPNQITDAVRVMVVYQPDVDYNGIAAQHPATQFLLISDQALQATANITVLTTAPDQVMFAGGYLTMLLANDWRSVGLIASDTSLGDAASWDYYNGGGYFCGRCSPIVPPYAQFPLVISLPAATDVNGWESGYQAIEENKFNVIFIDGAISNQEVYTRMAQRGLILLGTGTPPAGFESQWAATVGYNFAAAVESIWPGLLAGQSAGNITATIQVSNVNSALLGDGKINWFNEMAAELAEGLIAPEYQPVN
jgi:hypothetical protein